MSNYTLTGVLHPFILPSPPRETRGLPRLRLSIPKVAQFQGMGVSVSNVREPLTPEESDRLSNVRETPTRRLVVRTLLASGLRVGERCEFTPKDVLWL